MEVGMAAFAPFLGWIIDRGIQQRVEDPFGPMFFCSESVAATIALIYGWLHHDTEDEETRARRLLNPDETAIPVTPDSQAAIQSESVDTRPAES